MVVATAAEGGGTALRADGQVIWAVPRAPSEHIPTGVSEISVHASASLPAPLSLSQTISDPQSVQQVIALIESLHPPGGGFRSCPADRPGELVLDLEFRKEVEASPVAQADVSVGGCGSVELSVNGQPEGELEGAWLVAERVEGILGTSLLGREGEEAP